MGLPAWHMEGQQGQPQGGPASTSGRAWLPRVEVSTHALLFPIIRLTIPTALPAPALPQINLLSCKFMGPQGYGSTSDAVQCIDYCLQQRSHIISASWTTGTMPNPPLEEAGAHTQPAGTTSWQRVTLQHVQCAVRAWPALPALPGLHFSTPPYSNATLTPC